MWILYKRRVSASVEALQGSYTIGTLYLCNAVGDCRALLATRPDGVSAKNAQYYKKRLSSNHRTKGINFRGATYLPFDKNHRAAHTNRINAPPRISLLSSANQLRDDFPAHRSPTPSSLRASSLWEHVDYYFPSLFLNNIIIAILAVNVKLSSYSINPGLALST